ncbi:sporulation lipoprotein YhcN/YlaJ [Salsuginibacillus halophilus]|uniref:Sporulation lipoprotein YhcN/YlaJ n=1 Tax=Salsuginibacillus halophilus TaxID=517424 RepID=A0A2P8HWP6_9BACI|nr:YhcN/YlaJ family sporulation lipoprotein [Salsuginibacillus halophilus]PSL50585.1 sporulation lipoprotein YhcN/YlaJ [Salsuginibacillus halophilus]
MRKGLLLLCSIIVTSGCVYEKSSESFGAGEGTDDAYSGYGLELYEDHEGPLIDFFAPDDDKVQFGDEALKKNRINQEENEPFLSGSHQRKQYQRDRMNVQRSGHVNDKYEDQGKAVDQGISLDPLSSENLTQMEEVFDAYVVETDDVIYAGLAVKPGKKEPVLEKLKHEAAQTKISKPIKVYTDRRSVQRIQASTTENRPGLLDDLERAEFEMVKIEENLRHFGE